MANTVHPEDNYRYSSTISAEIAPHQLNQLLLLPTL